MGSILEFQFTANLCIAECSCLPKKSQQSFDGRGDWWGDWRGIYSQRHGDGEHLAVLEDRLARAGRVMWQVLIHSANAGAELFVLPHLQHEFAYDRIFGEGRKAVWVDPAKIVSVR